MASADTRRVLRTIHNPQLNHSLLNAVTGLLNAALMACILTVINAMRTETAPAIINIHVLIFILYSKSCNHLFIKYQASGDAMINASTTSFKKSLLMRLIIPDTDAPNTLRIPISLVRFTT